MKQYLCNERCFVSVDGAKPRIIYAGSVIDAELDPGIHFTCLDSEDLEIDFATASEELLSTAEFDLQDMKDFCEKNYKVKISKQMGAEKSIKKFLDARFRSIDPDVKKTNPTAF